MDLKQQLARARPCKSCGEKRTVVQWLRPRWDNKLYPDWQLCGACLIDALKLLLSPNLKRKKGGKKP